MECHICGTTEELEVYGEFHLCPDCRDEHLKQCSDCGEYFIDNENDYVIDREGDIYCESCRDELILLRTLRKNLQTELFLR